MMLFAIKNENVTGVLNGVAPQVPRSDYLLQYHLYFLSHILSINIITIFPDYYQ